MEFKCLKCGKTSMKPMSYPCFSCGFDIDHLTGIKLSQFQVRKWDEHSQLITGQNISLFGKEYNCSFDYNGISNISDLVTYTINYGTDVNIPSNRGAHVNPVKISFIPEIIGSGTSVYYNAGDTFPCSGCCVISPVSIDYGHPFPILRDWVIQEFGTQKSTCFICGKDVDFGLSICNECYEKKGGDWHEFLV